MRLILLFFILLERAKGSWEERKLRSKFFNFFIFINLYLAKIFSLSTFFIDQENFSMIYLRILVDFLCEFFHIYIFLYIYLSHHIFICDWLNDILLLCDTFERPNTMLSFNWRRHEMFSLKFPKKITRNIFIHT